VGTAIQIIENLGNKKFKDHGIFPLVEAPADYIPVHEGNEWNDFINAIQFRDLDKDGDLDLYFSNNLSQKTNGMVLLNHGDFTFELLLPHAAKIVDGRIVTKAPVSEEQKAKEQAMEDELAEFEAQLEEELAIEVTAAKAKRIAEEAAMKAELAADISRIKAEIAAEVAAAKAKRIAEEEAAKAELAEENKSSPLFDGRYSFDLFRYHDDEDWQELGNGFVEIRNGEVMIDKDNSELKTGSKDLYDTFGGQINKKGKVSASMELDILSGGVDRSEIYHLNGHIDGKIWGDSPREDFFRVYFLLAKE
jgi:hypothetical protein